METLTLHANAKINLYLKVTGKRPDGYHELVTVMQSVSLADTLHFTRTAQAHITVDSGGLLPDDEKNLVNRAARAYFAATNAPFGLAVKLEKHIPMEAGLGGGSADAAATLRALNLLDGNRFDEQKLIGIAATVGADVPFCLVGGTRLCRGIGEQMQPIENNLTGTLVVANGAQGVSTPVAFAEIDRLFGDFSLVDGEAPAALIDALKKGDLRGAVPHFENVFERVIEPIRPAVGACKRLLVANGAAAAMMSGSGPCVWGLFEKEPDAQHAVQALHAAGYRAFACRMTGQKK